MNCDGKHLNLDVYVLDASTPGSSGAKKVAALRAARAQRQQEQWAQREAHDARVRAKDAQRTTQETYRLVAHEDIRGHDVAASTGAGSTSTSVRGPRSNAEAACARKGDGCAGFVWLPALNKGYLKRSVAPELRVQSANGRAVELWKRGRFASGGGVWKDTFEECPESADLRSCAVAEPPPFGDFERAGVKDFALEDPVRVKLQLPEYMLGTDIATRIRRGDYEKDERVLVSERVPPSARVLEVGACVGAVSVTVNARLADRTQHVVVEANPRLVPLLSRTKELNNAGFHVAFGMVVGPAASGSEKEGEGEARGGARFQIFDKIVAGSAHRSDGQERDRRVVRVPTFTVAALAARHGVAFDTLIVDIEGGELAFFRENAAFLRRGVARVVAELHGNMMGDDEFNARVVLLLEDLGFDVEVADDNTFVFVDRTKTSKA